MKLKNFIPALLCFLLVGLTFSTEKASGQTLPEFKVKLTDGKTFSAKEFSHNKPLLLIYFAPDCEHCRAFMNQLMPKMDEFTTTEILMVTFESSDDVAWFINHYKINNYRNIKVGMEVPVFFLKNYYHLEHTPFTALFDKKGKLMVSYKEQTPLSELIKWVKVVEKG